MTTMIEEGRRTEPARRLVTVVVVGGVVLGAAFYALEAVGVSFASALVLMGGVLLVGAMVLALSLNPGVLGRSEELRGALGALTGRRSRTAPGDRGSAPRQASGRPSSTTAEHLATRVVLEPLPYGAATGPLPAPPGVDSAVSAETRHSNSDLEARATTQRAVGPLPAPPLHGDRVDDVTSADAVGRGTPFVHAQAVVGGDRPRATDAETGGDVVVGRDTSAARAATPESSPVDDAASHSLRRARIHQALSWPGAMLAAMTRMRREPVVEFPPSAALAASLAAFADCLQRGGSLADALDEEAALSPPGIARRLRRASRSVRNGTSIPAAVEELASDKEAASVSRILSSAGAVPWEDLPSALRQASQAVADESRVGHAQRALRREARLAASAIIATPVVVVLLRLGVVPGLTIPASSGPANPTAVTFATALAVVGGAWVIWALRPPVMAGITRRSRSLIRPMQQRDRMEAALPMILDAAALRVTGDTGVDAAIAALADDGPAAAAVVEEARGRLASSQVVRTDGEPVVSEVVDRLLEADRTAEDARSALASTAAQIRSQRLQRLRAQTNRIPVVAAVPFVVCVLPATLLLLLL